jgi:hypothetical protein
MRPRKGLEPSIACNRLIGVVYSICDLAAVRTRVFLLAQQTVKQFKGTTFATKTSYPFRKPYASHIFLRSRPWHFQATDL